MARVVVSVEGKEVVVEGRAAVMVAYLAKNQDRVNVAEKGDVTFNFGHGEMTPKIVAIDAQLVVGR